MRIASLAALVAAAALLAPSAAAQCTGTEGTDFFRVPVSDVNAIPQANIDQLNAAGPDLTITDIQTLLTSDLEGQLVEITGAVMSDPQLSGLASLNGDGIPGRIHYWVRDSAAATGDPAGQTVQIVDAAGDGFAQSLQVGLEVTVCGFVSPFVSTGGKTMQISPLANQTAVVGSFPTDSPIFDPVVITTDDIHDTYTIGGEVKSQMDWSVYADFNGQYVRFEGIELLQGVQGDRPNLLFASAGQESQINQYDTSVCFRNDRGADYFPNGNVPSCITDGDFQPPPTGVVNLQGFLQWQGDDGGFNYSVPDPANFVISPIEATDFELTTAPPTVVVTGPTTIPGPTDDVTITIQAIPGDGTIASVVVDYTYESTGTTGQATATNTSGDTYEAVIPAGPNDSFVSYSATATDTEGGSTTSETQAYRIFSGPVTAISQIQTTFDGGPGDSPLYTGAQAAIEINLTARVQSLVPVGGGNFLAILQDDASLAPFTGIWAFVGTNPNGLAVGQEINITEAELTENFDVTELSGLTATVTGTPGPYPYKVVPTAVLAASDAAEQHEGMMIRFENVSITDTNADGDDTDNGFGEWQFTNGALADEVRADDRSENIPNDFNLQNLPVGASVDFIQGAWYFSFGNYKLVPVELSDIGMISTAGENEAAATALALTVAPNPLRGSATIRFETPANGAVSLRVYDVTGREVAVLLDRELAAGSASATLDASALAAGVYVVRLQAGTTVATTQLSVIR